VGQTLMRYEGTLHRMRQRNLHDLERLQARRRGEAVAAPVIVDVNHSIAPHGRTRVRRIDGFHSNGQAGSGEMSD